MFPGGRPPSIFSAKKLNYCVRNGNRCDLLAITTDLVKTRFSARFISEPSPFQAVSPLSQKTYWVFREPCFAFAPLRPLHLIVKHNVLRLIKRKVILTHILGSNISYIRSSPRPISIGQLNMLPCLHLRPINHIVYVGSYLFKTMGNLILGWTSRLDAFSVYSFRT